MFVVHNVVNVNVVNPRGSRETFPQATLRLLKLYLYVLIMPRKHIMDINKINVMGVKILKTKTKKL